MRRRGAGWSALVVLAVAMPWPARAATQEVDVGSYYYEDSTPGDGQVTINAGDQITFTFYEGIEHTATVNGLFDSGRHWGRQTYTTSRLTRAGTYTLYCTVHGAATMSTRLVIRGSATSPAPKPTRSPSHRPTPTPTPTRRTSPSPTVRTSALAHPPPSSAGVPTAATAPAPTPTPTSSPSPSPTPSPRRPDSSPAGSRAPTPALSSEQAPATTAPDVARAEPLDGSGSSPLVPVGIVLTLLLAGAGAIALGRRRAG